ncbi:hypothetical protein ILUMI_22115 [Ignelater luminosus]|uniref:Craniofacial development protein 2-like n=1 Tax=Ignelater luminosus TaxID=2038154 RepID=A0A8K0CDC3_IGNLU|nr:hypothetical protein ILUMI_22115 [Ignelater luminosus]
MKGKKKAIGRRKIIMSIKLYGHDTTIIGSYAPIDGSERYEKEEYYGELSDVLQEYPRNKDAIIVGDLNARVNSQEDRQVIGKYAEDVENDNRQRTYDTKVKREANCGTDHHVLETTIVFPFSCNSRKEEGNQDNITELNVKRYKLRLLQQPSICDLVYQRRLANRLNHIAPSANTEEEYNNIKTTIHEIAGERPGRPVVVELSESQVRLQ